jgi:hypothetical protein
MIPNASWQAPGPEKDGIQERDRNFMRAIPGILKLKDVKPEIRR